MHQLITSIFAFATTTTCSASFSSSSTTNVYIKACPKNTGPSNQVNTLSSFDKTRSIFQGQVNKLPRSSERFASNGPRLTIEPITKRSSSAAEGGTTVPQQRSSAGTVPNKKSAVLPRRRQQQSRTTNEQWDDEDEEDDWFSPFDFFGKLVRGIDRSNNERKMGGGGGRGSSNYPTTWKKKSSNNDNNNVFPSRPNAANQMRDLTENSMKRSGAAATASAPRKDTTRNNNKFGGSSFNTANRGRTYATPSKAARSNFLGGSGVSTRPTNIQNNKRNKVVSPNNVRRSQQQSSSSSSFTTSTASNQKRRSNTESNLSDVGIAVKVREINGIRSKNDRRNPTTPYESSSMSPAIIPEVLPSTFEKTFNKQANPFVQEQMSRRDFKETTSTKNPFENLSNPFEQLGKMVLGGNNQGRNSPTRDTRGMSLTRRSNKNSQMAIQNAEMALANNLFWSNTSPITVQGGNKCRKTWRFTTSYIERVGVFLTTEGRPVNATIELWEGPNNAPVKLSVYSENGYMRPIRLVIETPRGSSNSISICNVERVEFPLEACVQAEVNEIYDDYGYNGGGRLETVTERMATLGTKTLLQGGGTVVTYPFPPYVASIQVLLENDGNGRPINGRIELLQGPNSSKQIIDVYTEDGMERPIFVMIESPGSENMIRVMNTGSLERPMIASVEPFTLEPDVDDGYNTDSYFIVD